MDTERGVIFIAEQHSLQNDLLVCHLDQNTGLKCVSVSGMDKFRSVQKACSDHQLLILFDCHGIKNSDLFEFIEFLSPEESTPATLALMNVNTSAAIEKTALELGVRGFFYEEDSITDLVRGINAIFSGDVWISRKKMFECITRAKSFSPHIAKKQSILTRREVEILRLLSRGGTNESIATSLCISSHTVRTHIYNIFKKIDVPNRLQASLWAAKYL